MVINKYIGHPLAENMVERARIAGIALHKIAVEVVIPPIAPEPVTLRSVLIGAAKRSAVEAAIHIVHRNHHND